MNNAVVLDWVKQLSQKTEHLLSVCTGDLILAKAGLLDGLTATTHQGALSLLQDLAPKTTIDASRRFIDNGKIIVSAGIPAIGYENVVPSVLRASTAVPKTSARSSTGAPLAYEIDEAAGSAIGEGIPSTRTRSISRVDANRGRVMSIVVTRL